MSLPRYDDTSPMVSREGCVRASALMMIMIMILITIRPERSRARNAKLNTVSFQLSRLLDNTVNGVEIIGTFYVKFNIIQSLRDQNMLDDLL